MGTQGSLLDDVCRRHHRGDAQSERANRQIHARKGVIRQLILTFVRAQGERGATGEEIEIALSLKHQTVSARITEMKRSGLLYAPAGIYRETSSGYRAAVLVAISGRGA